MDLPLKAFRLQINTIEVIEPHGQHNINSFFRRYIATESHNVISKVSRYHERIITSFHSAATSGALVQFAFFWREGSGQQSYWRGISGILAGVGRELKAL